VGFGMDPEGYLHAFRFHGQPINSHDTTIASVGYSLFLCVQLSASADGNSTDQSATSPGGDFHPPPRSCQTSSHHRHYLLG